MSCMFNFSCNVIDNDVLLRKTLGQEATGNTQRTSEIVNF